MMTPQHSKRHSAVGVILSAGSPGRRIAVTLKQGAATWWRRALRTEVAASAVSGWNHPSHGSYGIGHPNRWCLFCNDFFRRSRDLMRAQIRGGGKGGGGGVGVSVCWYDFESQRILTTLPGRWQGWPTWFRLRWLACADDGSCGEALTKMTTTNDSKELLKLTSGWRLPKKWWQRTWQALDEFLRGREEAHDDKNKFSFSEDQFFFEEHSFTRTLYFF